MIGNVFWRKDILWWNADQIIWSTNLTRVQLIDWLSLVGILDSIFYTADTFWAVTDILFYIAILLTFRYVTLNAIHNDILYIKMHMFCTMPTWRRSKCILYIYKIFLENNSLCKIWIKLLMSRVAGVETRIAFV